MTYLYPGDRVSVRFAATIVLCNSIRIKLELEDGSVVDLPTSAITFREVS
mgnify:CR=1 FL=1